MIKRYIADIIREDLQHKMVFIGGPRQVGKTTLAKMIGEDYPSFTYLNWDFRPHREALVRSTLPAETNLLILDEIHKYPDWKSLIKGIWDTRTGDESILVTGSSRLDIYRRGGDSLLGRYHYFRLYPLTLKELNSQAPVGMDFPDKAPKLDLDLSGKGLDKLLFFGGFPEPLLSENERVLKRWQRERFERVFRDDIRETENIRSLAQIELLAAMLPSRVTSPLSLNSLAEDLQTSSNTVKSWMDLLCRNYYTFKIPPYHKRLERALKKSSKYYLWDWSEIKDEGARFENLMAVHLLKYAHFIQDSHGISVELYYLRDTAKREVDFLLTWEDKPWILVETKVNHGDSLTSLNYFADKLGVNEKYVVCLNDKKDYIHRNSGVRVIPASRFLMSLV